MSTSEGQAMPHTPDPLDNNGVISRLEHNGILQRLALYEIPAAIAKNYDIPARLVEQIREEYKAEIVELRRNWRNWISSVEPLCNKNNMLIFLGNMARQAAKEGEYPSAIKAAQEMNKVIEREVEESATLDQAIMERIMSGDFEDAAAKSRELAGEDFTALADDTTMRDSKTVVYLEDPNIREIDEVLGLGEEKQ